MGDGAAVVGGCVVSVGDAPPSSKPTGSSSGGEVVVDDGRRGRARVGAGLGHLAVAATAAGGQDQAEHEGEDGRACMRAQHRMGS